MAPTPDWVKQLKPSGPQGHELLAAERAKSNVPVEKLQELLFTKEVIDRKQKVLDVLKSEKVFDKSQNYFAGRTERFETALARAKKLRNLRLKHKWTLEEYRMANELISEPGPYGLHDSMFLVIFLCLYTTLSCTNSCRLPLLNRAHPNSTMSFWPKRAIIKSSVVTPKPSSVTDPTFVASRQQQPGTLKTSHLFCTHLISLQVNGGLDLLAVPPTMP